MSWSGANAAFSRTPRLLSAGQMNVSPAKADPSASRTSSLNRLIVQAPHRAWREEVEATLSELVRLPVGWDGYRAEPVSFETANFALRMLESICGSDTPVPQLVPGDGGDMQIEWHTHKGDIELHVRGANSVHAWRSTENTGPNGEEINLTFNFLPIVAWIEQLSEPMVDADAAAA
ncbi:hypothetical protein [Shinella zoogloeoides]|uniref:Uncharacterized protein n=1 Tax=Shinella zoogloeoides TaxID=352475 RepID=A0A6N8TJB9_SHIZO|nr:hypothetical protein [Shinella zoogloeoides]MDX1069340.1 hypothetical protein [Sinorhizobium medicae]MXO01328.1 hypothetical protein [Shinella zoogloeoides]UEX81577.1 hypothetical protein K8M09_18775 [Shinella zoogloeoides]